jgi:hypothetical protein
MWRRLRRRTFGPSRPAVFPHHYGLVVLTAGAVALGVWFVTEVL